MNEQSRWQFSLWSLLGLVTISFLTFFSSPAAVWGVEPVDPSGIATDLFEWYGRRVQQTIESRPGPRV